MKKLVILSFFIVFSLTFFSSGAVLAQEDVDISWDVIEEVLIDEEMNANYLGISDPNILPDSSWYGLKRFWERIQETFTFNPVKRAELQLQRVNQRIVEAQKMAEKTQNYEDFQGVLADYKGQMEDIQNRINKMQIKNADKIDGFLDKFTEDQLKHRKIFEQLEEISPEQREKIETAKEVALEKLIEVLARVDNEKIEERITNAMERIEGSGLKQFKNIEVLKALEEKVPEQAKEAIIRAQENAMKRLGEDLNKIPESLRAEKFEKYVEDINGDKIKHLEIIEELLKRGDIPVQIKNRERQANEGVLTEIKSRYQNENGGKERLMNRLENNLETQNLIQQIDPEFIEKIEEINENNQDCICTMEWRPVCGVDGITYSNACFAECNGVEVDYEGECGSGGGSQSRVKGKIRS